MNKSSFKKIVPVVILVFMAVFALSGLVSAAKTPSFSIRPGTSSVKVGNTFKLTVSARNITDLSAYEVKLSYPADLLEIKSENIVSGLSGGITPVKNVNGGKITIAYAKTGNAKTENGNLTLCTLTFTAKKPGNAQISLDSAKLLNRILSKSNYTVDVKTSVNISTRGGGTPPPPEAPVIIKEGNTTTVSMKAAVFKKIVDSRKGVKIDAEMLTITFDVKAVNAISNAAGGDISIVIKEVDKASLSSDARKKIGDRPVYDFTVKAGNTEVTKFGGGKVEVSIPYTLKPGEKKTSLVVYYIDNSGKLKSVNCKYDEATGAVTFTVTHFSTYAVAYIR